VELYYHGVDRDVLILRADGGLNVEIAGQLGQELEQVVQSGIGKLIVDCGGLRWISSAGLGTLVRLHKRLRDRGGELKLAAIDAAVVRMLELTRLNRVFELYTTVGDARAAFRSATRP
jgi:anti-sigma B factor antagonist